MNIFECMGYLDDENDTGGHIVDDSLYLLTCNLLS